MPELPDVESFRHVLDSHGRGRRIEDVEVNDAGVLRGVTARRLRQALRGRRFRAPGRHGKWLIARTDGPAVLMHFGMTGELVGGPQAEERHPHDRVVFVLDHGRLCYRDQRKLQGIRLADDEAAVERLLADQGPDALDVGRQEFAEAIGVRRGGLKSALIDQSVLAGLGNLLADEILWRSRLHPSRPARELSDDELRRLHGETRRVLRQSVRAGRVPGRPSWLTGHRDDPHPQCPRCGGPLRRGRVAGRSTVWCPQCQPAD
ncbi:Fpg/Nei family DNA glycosylase [Streptomyces sp. RB6PN25]|uniref:Fpg/Nei family DNA glycosylase n=1 Tax=Streptomyces humicola TaxID=2953240 RepID=A0ABT1PQB0_9ACTN|nr:DNA-formamidopyrimidine glycosylase family protein [Streptomyces humicola]MCQ4079313.1 Fpg/Nei family DNA glycosylase [Streptomyces humicola]